MSVAEVFRIYREVKKIQEEAGITLPDPTDKDAVRRGLLGDGRGKPPEEVEKARRVLGAVPLPPRRQEL